MKVPFGLHEDTNRYIGIDEAKNGLGCGCVCPSCHMKLKARQGEDRDHHFAHHKLAQIECVYSYWVAVRSMSKQIIEEHGIPIEQDFLKILSSPPWNATQISISNIILDPKVRDHQFDIKVETSFGDFYIHLITDEHDEGRVQKHRMNQPNKCLFSPYLVLEIDISSIKEYENKDCRKQLETLLLGQKDNREWFSSNVSYMDYIKDKQYREEQRVLVTKYTQEKRQRNKENWLIGGNTSFQIADETVISVPLQAEKMIYFYNMMKTSYSFSDKLSENFTVVYRGKGFWFVSCCHEFFCVSYEEVYIAYEVKDGKVKRLEACFSFEELDYMLKSCVVERDNLL